MIRVHERLFAASHLADIRVALGDVRFRGQSGHSTGPLRCLLLTQSGHDLGIFEPNQFF